MLKSKQKCGEITFRVTFYPKMLLKWMLLRVCLLLIWDLCFFSVFCSLNSLRLGCFCVHTLSTVLPRAAEIFVGQALLSSSSAYSVKQFIGEGCYGKVARCLNRRTKREVAVKILKTDPNSGQDTENEVDSCPIWFLSLLRFYLSPFLQFQC